MASGRVVDLPSVSQRRLLAVLALHTRTAVRAEWLADAFEVSPGALRTQVSRLRKVLGDGNLSTAGTGYRLDVDVDAEAFCRELADAADGDEIGALERALARWAGARARGVRGRGVGGRRSGAAHRAARLGDGGSGRRADRRVALVGGSRPPRGARRGVPAPRPPARPLDGGARGRGPPGRSVARVPAVPRVVGGRGRDRAVGRGARDRAAHRDELGDRGGRPPAARRARDAGTA